MPASHWQGWFVQTKSTDNKNVSMALKIFERYETLSAAVADEILKQVEIKPQSVLCLAAGETPRLAYGMVADAARRDHVDFSRCTFVGLDEWIGIPPENEGSCAYFLEHNLFIPLGVERNQINLFNALTHDPQKECERMDTFIKTRGGIDLMLVGVGMNGHIGFNEPGAGENLHAHVIDLEETTRSVGQKYFKKTTLLQQGITLGLRHLLESRKALMVASGKKKADIIRRALQEPITTDVPASIIRKHPNGDTMLDKDAASALTII